MFPYFIQLDKQLLNQFEKDQLYHTFLRNKFIKNYNQSDNQYSGINWYMSGNLYNLPFIKRIINNLSIKIYSVVAFHNNQNTKVGKHIDDSIERRTVLIIP